MRRVEIISRFCKTWRRFPNPLVKGDLWGNEGKAVDNKELFYGCLSQDQIALSFFISQQTNKSKVPTEFLPVLNVDSRDYELKTETIHCLSPLSISEGKAGVNG